MESYSAEVERVKEIISIVCLLEVKLFGCCRHAVYGKQPSRKRAHIALMNQRLDATKL